MVHRSSLLTLLLFLVRWSACLAQTAPTVLWPGEVVVTGYNATDGASDWSFAPLVDLAPGTQLQFTNNGWRAAGGFRPGQGVATYTVPAAGVPKGHTIIYSGSSGDFAGGLTFNSSGDQLLVYQGSDAAPTFVTALTYPQATWDADATSDQTSALPTGLMVGTTAAALPYLNAALVQEALRQGLPAALRVAHATPGNWTGGASRQSLPGGSLTVSEGLVPDAVELTALKEIYASTGGANWFNRTNWLQGTNNAEHWATWYGLGTANGDVVRLEINGNNPQGTLPASLGNLTALTELKVPNNPGLSGPLPTTIGNLRNLTSINAIRSYFSGQIPRELGQLTQLQYLLLTRNHFTGIIPRELGQLTNLIELDINNYVGDDPTRYLDLQGGLPPELTNLTKLQHLDVSDLLHLGGELPPGLGKLTQLDYICVDGNGHTGSVPAELTGLPQLRALIIYNNRFTEIPPLGSFTNVSNLVLRIENNLFDFGALEPLFTGPGQLPFSTSIVPRTGEITNYKPQKFLSDEQALTVVSGQPIILTSGIGGTKTHYQWQRQVGATWTELPGATAATYQLASASPADAGRYRCQALNDWVTGLTLYSRPWVVTVTAAATKVLPPSDPSEDRDRNWSYSRTFDLDGNVTSERKQFSDALGRPTQSQAKNLAEHHVFATQSLTNTGGVAVLATLPAPINNQEFKYKTGFVTATTAQPDGSQVSREYAPINFEKPTGGATPDPLDETTPGTLGYYYSSNNTWEPAIAATHNPYSLSEPLAGPLGGMRRAAGPGDELRLGSGREMRGRDFPLLNELDAYTPLRAQFVPGSPTPSLRAQGVKVVTLNANGIESISFANREGQALAGCLSGDQYPVSTLTGSLAFDPANAAGSPIYQDIHIAASATPTTVTVTEGATTGASSFVVIDLLQNPLVETAYSGAQSLSLTPGFYRLQATSGQVSFSYPVHYGNFSYVFYDDAGRAVARIAPKGAEGLNAGPGPSPAPINLVTNPSFDQEDWSTSTPSGWQTDGDDYALYTSEYQGAHSGTHYATHYDEGPYAAFTHQVIANLPAGRYTLRAWTKSSGGQAKALLAARNYGGPALAAAVPATPNGAEGMWTLVELKDVAVSNGQCDIGVESQASANQFLYFDDVEFFRQPDNAPAGGNAAAPQFVTRNVFDTAGRVLSTTTPDEGTTRYVYARDGRLRFSQSAVQAQATTSGAATPRFSYSTYDRLGRVVESGEYTQSATPGQGLVFEDLLTEVPAANSVLQSALLEERVSAGPQSAGSLDAARCAQRNQVWYDVPQPDAALGGRQQDFVLGAVAKTSNGTSSTWYSYNDLGQLTWLVQQASAPIGVKTVDYSYDAAGNVTQVTYQQGQPDSFYHYYTYDANQRLTTVATSPDGVTRTEQARYFYYLHGPLKRVETAGTLQGTDYTYTVQGWLKSINGANRSLNPDKPGVNGFQKDLFGLTLDYFSGDYRSAQAGPATPSIANAPATRYDGTVRSAAWYTAANPAVRQHVFSYDAKGQLQQADYGQLLPGGSPTAAGTFVASASRAYEEGNLSYDPNGNLGTLRRRDGAGLATDDFTYKYLPGTNKLAAVNNPAGAAVLDYDYDATGQMTRQRDEKGQRYLTYDVSGKVTGVYRDEAHQQPLVVFTYDDRGFRARKQSYDPTTYQLKQTTYSVRDAAGNELSTYVQDAVTPGSALQRSEVPLYGASRLGTLTRLEDGNLDYRYELNDQLGNARVIYHKPTSRTYVATMEPGVASQEEKDFTSVASTRFAAPGHGGSATVARLGMGSGLSVGPGKILSVQQGDTVTFTAYAWLTAAMAASGQPASQPAARSASVVVLAAPLPAPTVPPLPTGSTDGGSPAALGQLRLGLRFSLGAGPVGGQPVASSGSSGGFAGNAQLHYIVRDKEGNVKLDDYQSANPATPGTWQQLQVGLRLAQGGTVELRVETDGALGPDVFFDDTQVQLTASTIVQEQHQYAFGAPMRGLNYTVGSKNYRHGYQGQFAEKDEETGLDAFELRLYDSRIGRWTAPDPVGQFASPYVGMGNNPVSGVDPDGGFALDPFIKIVGNGLLHQSYHLVINWSVLGNAFAAVGRASVAAAPYGLQAAVGGASTATRAQQEPSQQGPGKQSQRAGTMVMPAPAPPTIPPGLAFFEGLVMRSPVVLLSLLGGDTDDARHIREQNDNLVPMWRNVGDNEYQSYLRKGYNFGAAYGMFMGKEFWATPPPEVWLNSRFGAPHTIHILVSRNVIGKHKLVQGHIFYEGGHPHAGYIVESSNINAFNIAKKHLTITHTDR